MIERKQGHVTRIAGAALAAGLFLLWFGAPVGAQVSWESPLMVAPETPAGWGVYLVDPAPGTGVGVFTGWRSGGPWGYRIGIAEDSQEKVAVFGGVDISGTLVQTSEDIPVDVHWVGGAGVGVGDETLLSFPLGVSIGRAFHADQVWFNPYATPRVVLDARVGGDGTEEESDTLGLAFLVDLGLDVSFDPGWAVRFAAFVGERRGLAIGISFRVF